MALLQNILGQKFSRLTAVKLFDIKRNGSRWLCRCECGRKIIAAAHDLKRGRTVSCGCMRRDKAVARFKSHPLQLRHGHSRRNIKSPEYISWCAMIARCTNPNTTNFSRYGGLGIKICERWRKFDNFLADMGERPLGTTLDRFPNKHGDYEPGNCRWATRLEQRHNRRSLKVQNALV